MLKVKSVIESSIAESLGIKAGDQIFSVDGKNISSQSEFNREIFHSRSKQADISIEWRRNGQTFEGVLNPNKQIGLIFLEEVEPSNDIYESNTASLQGRSYSQNVNNNSSSQSPSKYGFARFTGVLTTVIGILILLAGIYIIFDYFGDSSYRRELVKLVYGLSGVACGVITMGIGQVISAVTDAADNSFKILEKLDKK